MSAAAAARALAPAVAQHARGEWRSLGRRRAGVRRAEVGVRWRAAPGPAGCVRWHEQLQARGGVVEDDGVERRSGAAASAALVVHQEDEKAARPGSRPGCPWRRDATDWLRALAAQPPWPPWAREAARDALRIVSPVLCARSRVENSHPYTMAAHPGLTAERLGGRADYMQRANGRSPCPNRESARAVERGCPSARAAAQMRPRS